MEIVALAKTSPLVATVLPTDKLDSLAYDYRLLRGLAQMKTPDETQREQYQACLDVLEAYKIHLFRRNFALLLVLAGRLYRIEFRSFPEFALARANLKRSQAYKACANALLTLTFDSVGKRHLMPCGDMEEALVKLHPDHWLPAWEEVLASTPEGALDIDHVKITLHEYCIQHPSALPQRHKLETRLLPPIVSVTGPGEAPSKTQSDTALRKLERALEKHPGAAQLQTFAATHKGGTAAFLLRSLQKIPPTEQAQALPATQLLAILNQIDPAVGERAEQEAADILFAWFAAACERRHHHLGNRRAEYLRRRERANATKEK
jgi:hypothetical protein